VTHAVVHTATLVGVHAVPVQVEADVGAGLPTFAVVGLADTAVLEARERVRSAVRAAGFTFPAARVVVNLAPAPLRKHGTGFDLPIAAAVLAATGQIPAQTLASASLVGELSLDGAVRPVAGLLAHALAARSRGHSLCVAESATGTLAPVTGLDTRGVGHLSDLRSGLPDACDRPSIARRLPATGPDLSEVRGQALAKRVLEIAAAGGHNMLMTGPPGSGKTMLARRLPGILPPLDPEEALESALVRSVAGLEDDAAGEGRRPFRSPHHTCSLAGLVGGGSPPRPGEISLAHTGVLFLDELPEFAPSALQALRQPLEDGRIILVRAEGRVAYPARFSLVAAMNPCPCGFHGDSQRACRCTEPIVSRYQARVGGPLLDRIDLFIRVDRIPPERMLECTSTDETTEVVRERVETASRRAGARGGPSARLSGSALLAVCALDRDAADRLARSARDMRLSGRGITRLLRVARTIADLDGSAGVGSDALMEAIAYRAWETA